MQGEIAPRLSFNAESAEKKRAEDAELAAQGFEDCGFKE